MSLFLILLGLILFIVAATTVLKLHPFLTLLAAAVLAALLYGLPLAGIATLVGEGFGGIMGQIGLVIVLGTVIGIILERTGSAVAMAEAVIRLLGNRFPTLTLSLVGYIVSIPVFCDSGFVILNSLKNALAQRMNVSMVAMSVALATGLYATHTFVPPTPGPIAAAGNVGLGNLGLLIGLGALVSLVATLAGNLWANRFLRRDVPLIEETPVTELEAATNAPDARLPGATAAFAPIFVPILLICLGSVAALPSHPMGEGGLRALLAFVGSPLIALLAGLAFACALIRGSERLARFQQHVSDGIAAAAPILLITGAGGAFGAVLKATPLGTELSALLLTWRVGLLAPFLIAAGFKTAQGSTTVALVATSAMMAPLLPELGYDSDIGRCLVVLAVGAGAMTVSHVNDSFFWVVSQFSRMPVATAYRAITAATLVQGVSAMLTVYLLGLALLP